MILMAQRPIFCKYLIRSFHKLINVCLPVLLRCVNTYIVLCFELRRQLTHTVKFTFCCLFLCAEYYFSFQMVYIQQTKELFKSSYYE